MSEKLVTKLVSGVQMVILAYSISIGEISMKPLNTTSRNLALPKKLESGMGKSTLAHVLALLIVVSGILMKASSTTNVSLVLLKKIEI